MRKILEIMKAQPTMEGAGVRLNRVFGYHQVPRLDPFLLLDNFKSPNPDDYTPGFPWHPHRGIETVTYMINGEVEHGDSIGNKGVIGSGDVQWMTAGSGIIHSEMPRPCDGVFHGFQLWCNLPATHKMMPPRYREIKSRDIPVVQLDDGVEARVICGRVADVEGAVVDIVSDPRFLDVTVPPGVVFSILSPRDYTVFAYSVAGSGTFSPRDNTLVPPQHLVVYNNGEAVEIHNPSTHEPLRFLLVSGKPINEPIAWQGPIVMNTREELEVAFREFHDGTFIK